MTVGELLDRVSSRELTEWMIFYSIEPFGSDAQYIGHAITAATVANVNRGKGQRAFEPKDFMPEFEKGDQSIDEQIQIAEMFTIALGGKDLRGDE